ERIDVIDTHVCVPHLVDGLPVRDDLRLRARKEDGLAVAGYDREVVAVALAGETEALCVERDRPLEVGREQDGRDAGEPHSSRARPTVSPGGSESSRSSASSTPSANDSRAVVSCRIVSSCPSLPKMTS